MDDYNFFLIGIVTSVSIFGIVFFISNVMRRVSIVEIRGYKLPALEFSFLIFIVSISSVYLYSQLIFYDAIILPGVWSSLLVIVLFVNLIITFSTTRAGDFTSIKEKHEGHYFGEKFEKHPYPRFVTIGDVIRSLIAVSPAFILLMGRDLSNYGFIVVIAIWISMSPFAVPTALSPEMNDTNNPLLYFIKYTISNIDSFFKGAVVTGVVYLLFSFQVIPFQEKLDETIMLVYGVVMSAFDAKLPEKSPIPISILFSGLLIALVRCSFVSPYKGVWNRRYLTYNSYFITFMYFFNIALYMTSIKSSWKLDFGSNFIEGLLIILAIQFFLHRIDMTASDYYQFKQFIINPKTGKYYKKQKW